MNLCRRVVERLIIHVLAWATDDPHHATAQAAWLHDLNPTKDEQHATPTQGHTRSES